MVVGFAFERSEGQGLCPQFLKEGTPLGSGTPDLHHLVVANKSVLRPAGLAGCRGVTQRRAAHDAPGLAMGQPRGGLL
jgi:hypothetical protein